MKYFKGNFLNTLYYLLYCYEADLILRSYGYLCVCLFVSMVHRNDFDITYGAWDFVFEYVCVCVFYCVWAHMYENLEPLTEARKHLHPFFLHGKICHGWRPYHPFHTQIWQKSWQMSCGYCLWNWEVCSALFYRLLAWVWYHELKKHAFQNDQIFKGLVDGMLIHCCKCEPLDLSPMNE